jgi:hypothetical protein
LLAGAGVCAIATIGVINSRNTVTVRVKYSIWASGSLRLVLQHTETTGEHDEIPKKMNFSTDWSQALVM